MKKSIALLGVAATFLAAGNVAHAQGKKPAPVAPASPDDAGIVALEVPAQMAEGETGKFKVVVKNRGTSTWDETNFRLGVVKDFAGDACRFIEGTGAEPNRIHLPAGKTIKPGEEHTFEFAVKAPKGVRLYLLELQMVHEGVKWFGGIASRGILVTPAPGSAPPAAPAPPATKTPAPKPPAPSPTPPVTKLPVPVPKPNPTPAPAPKPMPPAPPTPTPQARDAAIVRIEAPDRMSAGQKGRIKVVVKNTGTTTWNPGFRLGAVGDGASDVVRFTEKTGQEPNRFHLPPGRMLAPGQENEFAFDVIAPMVPRTYKLRFQMIEEGVTWFGPIGEKSIEVVAPTMHQAGIVKVDIPDVVGADARFRMRITVVNAGTDTWDSGYRLGVIDDLAGDAARFLEAAKLEPNRIQIPSGVKVAPGQQHEFAVNVVAPTTLRKYLCRFQMIHEGVTWFGGIAEKVVEVVPPAMAPKPPTPTGTNVFRKGRVRPAGHGVQDDDGPFQPLGTTLFWAAWGYKHDRPKLERALDFMARNGFHYFRALGVVGDAKRPDYWDGREIDFNDPDHAATIAGVTDLAYDVYGIRVEWTLIGDGQVTVPTHAEKQALADRFLAMSRGREHKIMHFEAANESWQNGFGGPQGKAELRWLTKYLNDRTDILVAASAPDGYDQMSVSDLYAGNVADMATMHFDRDVRKADGAWRPVRQPWEFLYYNDVPPIGSNNEPIGPGASVASEDDPVRLVSGAVAAWVSGVAFHVFHTVAGIRGLPQDGELEDMPGARDFAMLQSLVPPDLSSWNRKNAHWADAPFKAYAKDSSGRTHVDTMWPDLGPTAQGAVRAYGAVKGNEIFCYPMGIQGTLTLEPRRAVSIDIYDPITGDRVGGGDFAAGQKFDVSGRAAVIIKGRYR